MSSVLGDGDPGPHSVEAYAEFVRYCERRFGYSLHAWTTLPRQGVVHQLRWHNGLEEYLTLCGAIVLGRDAATARNWRLPTCLFCVTDTRYG